MIPAFYLPKSASGDDPQSDASVISAKIVDKVSLLLVVLQIIKQPSLENRAANRPPGYIPDIRFKR